VDVLIRLARAEPPVGTVLRVGEPEPAQSEAWEAVPFMGWLGLLRALSEVVGEAGD
jgi:hypothetical protein